MSRKGSKKRARARALKQRTAAFREGNERTMRIGRSRSPLERYLDNKMLADMVQAAK